MKQKDDLFNKSPAQPAIAVPEDIDAPLAEVSRLPNGVTLYTLDCTPQEVVRVSFVFRAGTSVQDTPFSASAAANLLAEGTARHTAQQIAERLDFHGSYYDVSLDRDYAVVTFVALSKFFPQTAELAREILLEPSFPQGEIETYREKRKQRLAVERSKVAYRARELFAATLFGPAHPYGVSYHQDLYDSLERPAIEELYRRRYTAENCIAVCSGRIGTGERALIAALAGDIPAGGDTSRPDFPAPQGGRFAFGDQPGAVQAAIRAGVALFPRTHPDYIPMQVVSAVLGGYFGSRLVRNLREERGYTYGVFSAMANMERSGYFAIGTEVATEVAQDALRQIFLEVERLRTETVGGDELEMVKRIMTGEVMRILDGPFGIADVTIENAMNGTDNGYLDRFLDEVRAITPERVRETAARYLDTEKFTVAVVGDGPIERM